MKASLATTGTNCTRTPKGSGTPSDVANTHAHTHAHTHVSNVYEESNEAFVYDDSKGSDNVVVKYRHYDAVLMDFM